jgi:hypothetical protein
MNQIPTCAESLGANPASYKASACCKRELTMEKSRYSAIIFAALFTAAILLLLR